MITGGVVVKSPLRGDAEKLFQEDIPWSCVWIRQNKGKVCSCREAIVVLQASCQIGCLVKAINLLKKPLSNEKLLCVFGLSTNIGWYHDYDLVRVTDFWKLISMLDRLSDYPYPNPTWLYGCFCQISVSGQQIWTGRSDAGLWYYRLRYFCL